MTHKLIEKINEEFKSVELTVCDSQERMEGYNRALKVGKRILDYYLPLLLQAVGEEILPAKKKKHDNIKGVYSDVNPNMLMDCNQSEAECYNAAIDDTRSRLKEIIEKIQK